MNQIHVLDQNTIDKIAAGEVVERPASVVKELAENAVDAGADRITVEIRDGGIRLIRVTDNGEGIEPEDIPLAFLRHATSKITDAADLRALASVSRVELITKTAGGLSRGPLSDRRRTGEAAEEIGAPDGTTIIVRDLFYNTPARAKFLKTPHDRSGMGAICGTADAVESADRLHLSRKRADDWLRPGNGSPDGRQSTALREIWSAPLRRNAGTKGSSGSGFYRKAFRLPGQPEL